MELPPFAGDDRAVPPVVGVILMVAITVILAAVVGTVAVGFTDRFGQSTPQSTFGFEYDAGTTGDGECSGALTDDPAAGTLTVAHESGEAIDGDQLYLITDAGEAQWQADCDTSADTVSTGDSIDVAVDADQTLRVVWEAEDGGQTKTIVRWDGPDD
jgi:flagellin-like protein